MKQRKYKYPFGVGAKRAVHVKNYSEFAKLGNRECKWNGSNKEVVARNHVMFKSSIKDMPQNKILQAKNQFRNKLVRRQALSLVGIKPK